MSDQEHAAKPAPPPTPLTLMDLPPTAEKRVAPFPSSVVLDEAIVGSSHAVPFVYPRVLNVRNTRAIVSVKPVSSTKAPTNDLERGFVDLARRRAEAFSPDQPTHLVAPDWNIPIRFSPRFSGDHEAEVQVLLRWPDDEMTDLRTVRVHGHARHLHEAPEHALEGEGAPPRPRESEEIPVADMTHVHEVDKERFKRQERLALIEASALAAKQLGGLADAEREIMRYQRQPKVSWWGQVAEMAVTMAIGSIASVVAKGISANLGDSKIKDAVVGDGIKEGLKWAGKKAFLSPTRSASTEERLAFFAAQHDALTTLQRENALVVDHQIQRLQHDLVKEPRVGVEKMRAIAMALESAGRVASETQRSQTTLQWMLLVARAANGSETVQVGGHQRTTTNLAGAQTTASRGVLKIQVSKGWVVGASIDGLAQPVADRLLDRKLSTEPIPIIIVGDGNVITRDEVGRVRHSPEVASVLGDVGNSRDEVQRHAHTQGVVDTVLGKSLREWGLNSITTDAKKAE